MHTILDQIVLIQEKFPYTERIRAIENHKDEKTYQKADGT